MHSQLADQDRPIQRDDQPKHRLKDDRLKDDRPKDHRTKDMMRSATEDHVLALVLPLLGILAVVALFVVAAWDSDGSANELHTVAVTAVTTLAAASGGHAAGAKDRSSTK
jgi:hypothetical protein